MFLSVLLRGKVLKFDKIKLLKNKINGISIWIRLDKTKIKIKCTSLVKLSWSVLFKGKVIKFNKTKISQRKVILLLITFNNELKSHTY